MVGHSAVSTHLAPKGGVWMVDVSKKDATQRRAVAETLVSMNREAFQRLVQADTPKGDVLGTARLAGIMGAKQTSVLVPLCHPVALTRLEVLLDVEDSSQSVRIQATVEAFDRTGVEMEAMTAASVAALTVYDMLKAFDHSMIIGPTRLLAKSGGRSGEFVR
ncbi:MAG: cyclic pyranopterin monophosphate synthase MoaC [Polyangiaceae bacterium]|nr:cyclic pyranopterin monophosphate synthase MoaC [Polyangiaceae bacterium]